jgi:hypothetical protein
MRTTNSRKSPNAPTTNVFIALAAGLLAATIGCDGGREGDRCIPTALFSHNDCNSGLTCVQPANTVNACAESYCCPTGGTSSNDYCNANLCPPIPVEGGSIDGGADAGDGDGGD